MVADSTLTRACAVQIVTLICIKIRAEVTLFAKKNRFAIVSVSDHIGLVYLAVPAKLFTGFAPYRAIEAELNLPAVT